MPTSETLVITTTKNILEGCTRAPLPLLIDRFRFSGSLEDPELKRRWRAAEKAIDKVRDYLKEQAIYTRWSKT